MPNIKINNNELIEIFNETDFFDSTFNPDLFCLRVMVSLERKNQGKIKFRDDLFEIFKAKCEKLNIHEININGEISSFRLALRRLMIAEYFMHLNNPGVDYLITHINKTLTKE